jgi:hypothetical protein
VVSLLLTSITIFSPGRVKRETVKVALSPAVEGVPESVLKTILGVFLGDDSEVFHSSCGVPQEFKKYMINPILRILTF